MAPLAARVCLTCAKRLQDQREHCQFQNPRFKLRQIAGDVGRILRARQKLRLAEVRAGKPVHDAAATTSTRAENPRLSEQLFAILPTQSNTRNGSRHANRATTPVNFGVRVRQTPFHHGIAPPSCRTGSVISLMEMPMIYRRLSPPAVKPTLRFSVAFDPAGICHGLHRDSED